MMYQLDKKFADICMNDTGANKLLCTNGEDLWSKSQGFETGCIRFDFRDIGISCFKVAV